MNGRLLSASKRCRLTVLFTVLLSSMASHASAGPVTNFDDIEFWFGSGANQSALAIDWNGQSTADNSLVWGYRWDGTAQGVEMLSASVEAVTGRRPELSTSGGTSDARFIRAYCPVIEFGLVGATMHQADERVAVTDIRALTGIYREFLGRWRAAA